MLVRDAGEFWQIVLQPEHADLCAQFVEAWSPRPEPFRSLEIVARRHDDGWAVWEREPGLDSEGRPRNFLDVQVPSHLAFYRAAIEAVTDQDAYAGLLLSMHGAGIYQGRYGAQPELKLTFADEVQAQVDDFVQEQESNYPARIASIGLEEDERWRNYKLLQVWDRLSLYFCLKDLEQGTSDHVGALPDRRNGDELLQIEPRGSWRVAMSPYPFAESPTTFTLRRRLVPKEEWLNQEGFRRAFAKTEPETIEITAEALV